MKSIVVPPPWIRGKRRGGRRRLTRLVVYFETRAETREIEVVMFQFSTIYIVQTSLIFHVLSTSWRVAKAESKSNSLTVSILKILDEINALTVLSISQALTAIIPQAVFRMMYTSIVFAVYSLIHLGIMLNIDKRRCKVIFLNKSLILKMWETLKISMWRKGDYCYRSGKWFEKILSEDLIAK